MRIDGWMLLSPVAPVRYTLAYTEEDETWSLVLSQAGCYRGTYRVCVLGQGRLCKVKAESFKLMFPMLQYHRILLLVVPWRD